VMMNDHDPDRHYRDCCIMDDHLPLIAGL